MNIFFVFGVKKVGSPRPSLLCIVAELAWGGYVAVAVGVGDRSVTGASLDRTSGN